MHLSKNRKEHAEADRPLLFWLLKQQQRPKKVDVPMIQLHVPYETFDCVNQDINFEETQRCDPVWKPFKHFNIKVKKNEEKKNT